MVPISSTSTGISATTGNERHTSTSSLVVRYTGALAPMAMPVGTPTSTAMSRPVSAADSVLPTAFQNSASVGSATT